MQNRLAIKKYHVKIIKNTYDLDCSPPDRITEFEFFGDGDNIRQDIARNWQIQKPSSSMIKDIIAINSKEKKRYNFTVGIENGLPGALQIYPFDKKTDERLIHSLFVDFRIIGFLPTGFVILDDINGIVSSNDRIDIKMVDETLGDVECKKISCKNPKSGSIAVYWIAPSLGYSIIRFECEDKEGLDLTELQVAKDAKSSIWFPVSSHFTRLHQGKLELSEKLKIEIISLNQSLDISYFTPAKMEVPAGTFVMMPPESTMQNYYWDGEKIVGESGSVFDMRKSNKENRFTRLRVLMVAAWLALISIACFRKYINYKKKFKQ
ncbi:MAG: hypothetical protein LBJ67_09310 [Planctomycetaceae bacterium]|nr:hypothetical protein [Planctomycetaceae bacterium]